MYILYQVHNFFATTLTKYWKFLNIVCDLFIYLAINSKHKNVSGNDLSKIWFKVTDKVIFLVNYQSYIYRAHFSYRKFGKRVDECDQHCTFCLKTETMDWDFLIHFLVFPSCCRKSPDDVTILRNALFFLKKGGKSCHK